MADTTQTAHDRGIEAAVTALQNIKSTYVKRHARRIAEAAVRYESAVAAVGAVQKLIGHTAVGSRRYEELTLAARKAYAGAQ